MAEVVAEQAPEAGATPEAPPAEAEPEAFPEPAAAIPEPADEAPEEMDFASRFDADEPALGTLPAPPVEEEGGVFRVTPAGDDEMEFVFSETCWVEVKDLDGRYLHAVLGEPNERLILVGEGPFDVKLGYVPGGGSEIQRRACSLGRAHAGPCCQPSVGPLAVTRAVRGMRDVLPEEARRWRILEDAIVDVLERFAYEEMRLPLLESTELFNRSIGAATDIVEKEMFSLKDRDGGSITLRPEGTASCARALLEHGLLHNRSQRVFYRGPMFRYERPQLGRHRQFHQVGAEAFGAAGPDVDAELIQLGTEIWRALGIEGEIRLELNTLGSAAARAAWRDSLVDYLRPRRAELDADSARRLDRSPLRILDSKSRTTQAVLADAPKICGAHRRRKRSALCGVEADA